MSRDGGATFVDTTWDSVHAVDQANPYRVAVHPWNGARALVAARDGLPLTFTRDYGQTWGNSTGGPVSVGQQGCVWVVLDEGACGSGHACCRSGLLQKGP